MPATLDRISPHQAKQDMGNGAMLVCAYDSDEKYCKNRLAGSISLDEFQRREESLPKDREIIFYCA